MDLMKPGNLPTLRVPRMKPLTWATLFYDFLPVQVVPEQIDWGEEVPLIISQRLASIACRLVEDLKLDVPDEYLEQLQEASFDWMSATLVTSARAAEDVAALGDQGIPCVVTKGPGIAKCAYRLAERPYTDIDVFVPMNRFEAVLRILELRGYVEEDRNVLPRPGLELHCREAVNLIHPSGGAIDVHHHIPPWYWGRKITFSQVHRNAQPLTLQGSEILCASPVDNLLISALHIVSDKGRPGATLMAWRDVLTMESVCGVEEIVARARGAGLCGWLSWVVNALPDCVVSAELHDELFPEDLTIPGVYRLSCLMPPGIGSRHVIGQAFRLPIANAALYLASMAWPSNEFLQRKNGNRNGRSKWWRGGFAGLRKQLQNDHGL